MTAFLSQVRPEAPEFVRICYLVFAKELHFIKNELIIVSDHYVKMNSNCRGIIIERQ